MPLKWAADVIAMHPHPYAFLQYIQEKTKEWTGSQACYILDWAQCACTTSNKSSGSKTSQVASAVLDVDGAEEVFYDWCGSRLDQTLGLRVVAPPPCGNGGGGSIGTMAGNNEVIMQPIF